MKRTPALLCAAALLSACADAAPTDARVVDPPGTRTVRDEAVGVSVAIPSEWNVVPDPVLFNTYGFALFDPAGPKNGGHDRSPVARVALAYEAEPADIEG